MEQDHESHRMVTSCGIGLSQSCGKTLLVHPRAGDRILPGR